jgi:hypothetical protein
MPRMMVYAWSDQDNSLNETKFGDHFIPGEVSDEAAIKHTIDYMRTQFPRRGMHFDSDRVAKMVWDVSVPAYDCDKLRPHSHMDDVIRQCIGFPGKQGKEFHDMVIDDVIIRVNEWINKTKQPRPVVGLAQWQVSAAEDVLGAIENGKTTISAELCARFGKTIWGGVLARESEVPLTIIASYVQTVMSSFKKDLSSYEQFRDFVIVDTKDLNFEARISEALAENRQVIALISMCKGGKRQDRIDFLFDQPVKRLVMIDEADFGAHKDGQTTPFKNGRKAGDVVVLMTGTNGDRAAGTWPVDHYLNVTYPELLMEKRG